MLLYINGHGDASNWGGALATFYFALPFFAKWTKVTFDITAMAIRVTSKGGGARASGNRIISNPRPFNFSKSLSLNEADFRSN